VIGNIFLFCYKTRTLGGSQHAFLTVEILQAMRLSMPESSRNLVGGGELTLQYVL
jgi:hypothetical protein